MNTFIIIDLIRRIFYNLKRNEIKEKISEKR